MPELRAWLADRINASPTDITQVWERHVRMNDEQGEFCACVSEQKRGLLIFVILMKTCQYTPLPRVLKVRKKIGLFFCLPAKDHSASRDDTRWRRY